MSLEKISIIGGGYVGLSLACLLGQKKVVKLIDEDENKIDLLLKKKSYLKDKEIIDFISNNKTSISPSSNITECFQNTDLYILCLPTNYNEKTKVFDTKILDQVIGELVTKDPGIPILIKSTIPIGYTNKKKQKYPNASIIFSPEFLREGSALRDNIYPSRIIIGDEGKIGEEISHMFNSFSKSNSKTFLMSSHEAESVKLFSNTFLAMRVSFFNELDSYCLHKELNSENVINGVSSDPRIGDTYNNPSFGYGGYCLPKDTKQMLSEFEGIPQSLMKAVIDSNSHRALFLAKEVMKISRERIGIYRLVMKAGSDNFRDSAIFNIIYALKEHNCSVTIFEPLIKEESFMNCKVEKDIDKFKAESSLIVSNRLDSGDLIDVKEKIFTRDIFNEN